jgi:hypothetical protein
MFPLKVELEFIFTASSQEHFIGNQPGRYLPLVSERPENKASKASIWMSLFNCFPPVLGHLEKFDQTNNEGVSNGFMG